MSNVVFVTFVLFLAVVAGIYLNIYVRSTHANRHDANRQIPKTAKRIENGKNPSSYALTQQETRFLFNFYQLRFSSLSNSFRFFILSFLFDFVVVARREISLVLGAFFISLLFRIFVKQLFEQRLRRARIQNGIS